MSQRDLMDQISDTIVEILERGRDIIQNGYYDLTPNEPFKCFKDAQKELTLATASKLGPAIEVVRNTKDSEWKYTRVKEEIYRFYIDCTIKSVHREAAQELLSEFASVVQSWLNQLENLKYQVKGSCATTYDSHCEDQEVEYKRGYGLHTARLDYFTKVVNSEEKFV